MLVILIRPDKAPTPSASGKATQYSTKLHIGMKSTPGLTTCDHDPRRYDQCNLHAHVIDNKNKSPVESTTNATTKKVAKITRPATPPCGRPRPPGPRPPSRPCRPPHDSSTTTRRTTYPSLYPIITFTLSWPRHKSQDSPLTFTPIHTHTSILYRGSRKLPPR